MNLKNLLLFLSIVLISNLVNAQSFKKENKAHRKEQNKQFKNPKESPLTKEDRATFKALEYFPLTEDYRVIAKFTVNLNPQLFNMPTSTDRLPEYSTYGELSFEINGKQYALQVYQNQELINEVGYENYLFIPFADETNAIETYGGGRYLDFRIPTTEDVFIDFNMAYNPYCAYNDHYSCPKVPEKNILPIRIEAGVLNMEY